MKPNKQKNSGDVSDEVEELLRAAEDSALLKLSLNSHTVHPSSSDLHPVKPTKKKNMNCSSDEVEELLKAAQDAELLKLSVNSHTVRPSSSDLHPELEQRFRGLKSGSKSKAKPEASVKRMPPPESDKVKEEVGEDDLFARFAALKGSLPKRSTSNSSVCVTASDTSLANAVGGSVVGQDGVDDDEEDEVEKVIRWAKDAARLDPPPPSDDDEDLKDDEYDDIETSDEDSDEDSQRNKQGKRK